MTSRFKYSGKFTAGRYDQGKLTMNIYRFTISLVTVESLRDARDQATALDRIGYFIHNELDSSILLHEKTDQQLAQQLTDTGMSITTLPEDPVDQAMGMMLYHKLTAIVEDRLRIQQVEIGSMLGRNMMYLHNAEDDSGQFKSIGWWNKPTLDHCDSHLLHSDKVVAMNNGQVWRDLDLAWAGADAVTTDKDNTVVFAIFDRDETK